HNFLRLPAPGHVTLPIFGRSFEIALLPVKSYTFSRTDVLSNQLTRVLFGKLPFRAAHYRDGLLWIAGTTDLLTGDAIGLSAAGVYRRTLPLIDAWALAGSSASARTLKDPAESGTFTATELIPPPLVGQIVAASCAFPGAFAPVELKYVSGRD